MLDVANRQRRREDKRRDEKPRVDLAARLPVIEAVPLSAAAMSKLEVFKQNSVQHSREQAQRVKNNLNLFRHFAPKYEPTAVAFHFMSPEFIRDKLAVVRCEHTTYEGPYSVNSPAMGTIDYQKPCRTCYLDELNCPAHLGYIELAVSLPNPLLLSVIADILQTLCPNCGRVLLPPSMRNDPDILRSRGAVRIRKIVQKIMSHAGGGTVVCPRNLELAEVKRKQEDRDSIEENHLISEVAERLECEERAHNDPGATDPTTHSHKTSAEMFGVEYGECPQTRIKYSAPKNNLVDWKITATITTAKNKTISRPVPIERIQCLFNSLRSDDLRLLGFGGESHPRNFILRVLPVIPEANRPPVEREGEKQHDHITMTYRLIIRDNNTIASMLAQRASIKASADAGDETAIKRLATFEYDLSKAIESLYYNIAHLMSNSDGGLKMHREEKMQSIGARLSGKEGLCRAASQGKRTDKAGRTVIGPGVMPFGAVILPGEMRSITIPERANIFNIDRLRQRALTGDIIRLIRASGSNAGEPLLYNQIAEKAIASGLAPPEINIGDLVHRKAEMGEDVIINRQPTLHRHSFIGAKAIYRQGQKTIKLHMSYTHPANADFDGDEMNISEPQTNRARAEVRHLFSAPKQIITAARSEPIMGLVFNCPTSGYLLSTDHDALTARNGGVAAPILTAREYAELVDSLLLDDSRAKTLPDRLRKHRVSERTPRAIFSLALPQGLYYYRKDVKEVPERDPKTGKAIKEVSNEKSDPKLKTKKVDRSVVIKDGVFVSGILTKKDLRDGIIHAIYIRYGGDTASRFITEASFILEWYLEWRGFTLALEHCLLPDPESAQAEVNAAIIKAKNKIHENNLDPPLTETEKNFREEETISALDSVAKVGMRLLDGDILGNDNPLGVMIDSGAKGSTKNLADMVGCLGEQFIKAERPKQNLHGNRCLPYFEANEDTIQARGFVRESFASGLRPASFIFHMAGSRLGLIDTAIMTASIGSINHRLQKVLENDSIDQFGAVRSSTGAFTSQSYGEGFTPRELMLVKSFESTGPVFMPFDLKSIAAQLNASE